MDSKKKAKRSVATAVMLQNDIDPDAAVFVISIVSQMLDMPEWTLRMLDRHKIVCPKRSGSSQRGRRMYCYRDIVRLQYIKYLMEERGVNLEGIRVIMEIKDGQEGPQSGVPEEGG